MKSLAPRFQMTHRGRLLTVVLRTNLSTTTLGDTWFPAPYPSARSQAPRPDVSITKHRHKVIHSHCIIDTATLSIDTPLLEIDRSLCVIDTLKFEIDRSFLHPQLIDWVGGTGRPLNSLLNTINSRARYFSKKRRLRTRAPRTTQPYGTIHCCRSNHGTTRSGFLIRKRIALRRTSDWTPSIVGNWRRSRMMRSFIVS